MNTTHLISALLAVAPIGAAFAEVPPHSSPTTVLQRRAVISSLEAQLQSNYVFPDVAKKLAKALETRQSHGAYNSMNSAEAFASALSTDLRTLGKDAHFRVEFDSDFHPHEPHQGEPSKEELDEVYQETASHGFGIQKAERLAGNVGYIELRAFGRPEMVGEAFSSAMQLLSGTDSLIVDLRRNGGGEPAAVANFMSHFFVEGDKRHLNDLYFRKDNLTRQYWTSEVSGTRYTKPVYVLISPRTFSGGEECAYDFKTQKRAILVGEVTGGGANPGDMYSLGNGFVAFIPNGRAINPVTHTNWEHVGVKPDIAASAASAQQAAYITILTTLLASAKNPDQREELQDALTKAQKGEVEQATYTLGR
jgi:hypothetical protein